MSAPPSTRMRLAAGMAALSAPALSFLLILGVFWLLGVFCGRTKTGFLPNCERNRSLFSCQRIRMGLSDELVNISFEAQIALAQTGVQSEYFPMLCQCTLSNIKKQAGVQAKKDFSSSALAMLWVFAMITGCVWGYCYERSTCWGLVAVHGKTLGKKQFQMTSTLNTYLSRFWQVLDSFSK